MNHQPVKQDQTATPRTPCSNLCFVGSLTSPAGRICNTEDAGDGASGLYAGAGDGPSIISFQATRRANLSMIFFLACVRRDVARETSVMEDFPNRLL